MMPAEVFTAPQPNDGMTHAETDCVTADGWPQEWSD